ncbi:MAG: undecaprenyl-diphosphate phosphatase [Clostridia bacterium]|nr:undecaprenyl-diphosphate phosphatase [Clostridia bacterium]
MILDVLKVLLLAIVEGITEWLPVSSTGHMILLEELLSVEHMSVPFYNMFLYVIQLGAILAVLVLFWNRLYPFSPSKSKEERGSILRLWGMVLIGVLPAAVIGLALDSFLEEKVFVPGVRSIVVAAALVLYGVLFILVERASRKKSDSLESLSALTPKTALLIGAFQVLSIIPGTSRSGSTVLGARLLGVSRTVAAEFSFFMAIPVMVGVSLLKVAKFSLSAIDGEAGYELSAEPIILLAVGFVAAFAVSLFVIRFLLDFVRRHSFECFGWYRILLGVFVLLWFLI